MYVLHQAGRWRGRPGKTGVLGKEFSAWRRPKSWRWCSAQRWEEENDGMAWKRGRRVGDHNYHAVPTAHVGQKAGICQTTLPSSLCKRQTDCACVPAPGWFLWHKTASPSQKTPRAVKGDSAGHPLESKTQNVIRFVNYREASHRHRAASWYGWQWLTNFMLCLHVWYRCITDFCNLMRHFKNPREN